MATDWIKMRIELQSHPKIVRILSATQSDKFRVIGGLHAVWSVFDLHSETGRLHGYTPALMDHIIGWDGFSQAMVDVGWLLFDGAETLSMPEFAEHNGKSAKRRAEDQKRKRNERKHPQPVQDLSVIDADKMRTESGLEKEKEKELTTNTTDVVLVASKPATLPDCPHQKIIDLYAKHLPTLPFPRVWEGARQKQLAARWRWALTAKKQDGARYASDEESALDFFDRYFAYVSQSDFLTGRSGKWSGCDLGWLTKPENFAKVISGNYENKEAA